MAAECETARRYRVRRPQETPLYRLVEVHYDEVKGAWEERFEERYGFWRGFVDGVVMRYLDCGVFSAGLARVRCGTCHADPTVIRKILEHIERRDERSSRAPPGEASPLPAAS